MSKSKGNVVTPDHLLDEYSYDAVRYWAARARLGTDTAFDPAVFKIGSKLVIKLFNASRFVLMQLKDPVPGIDKISAPLDKAIVQVLSNVVKRATDSFDKFEYAEALQATEECFWNFCDHYLELVKARSYSETDTTGRESAQATLFWTLKTFTRLFAPFMPYITEEIWSWRFQGSGKDASVHSTAWPSVSEVSSIKGDPAAFHAAVDVLGVIRGKKTEAQKGQRWGVSKLSVKAADVDLTILKTVLDDVLKAGGVDSNGLTLASNAANGGKKFEVELALAEAEEPKKA